MNARCSLMEPTPVTHYVVHIELPTIFDVLRTNHSQGIGQIQSKWNRMYIEQDNHRKVHKQQEGLFVCINVVNLFPPTMRSSKSEACT